MALFETNYRLNLVGALEPGFYVSIQLGIIIPTDELIFWNIFYVSIYWECQHPN